MSSLIARALFPTPNTYGWVIEKDHLADDDEKSAAGITGPSEAPDELLVAVQERKGHVFKLYDDDGELYYTGRLLTNHESDSPFALEEHEAFAPLDDFGMGWAGCTLVRWPGHSEWDCG